MIQCDPNKSAGVSGGQPALQHFWQPRVSKVREVQLLPQSAGMLSRAEGGPRCTRLLHACSASPYGPFAMQAHCPELHAGCQVVGVEIAEGAKTIQSHPFSGATAFMLGNEVRAALAAVRHAEGINRRGRHKHPVRRALDCLQSRPACAMPSCTYPSTAQAQLR